MEDLLKSENFFSRRFDFKGEKTPKKKLRKTQRARIEKSCWEKCHRAYVSRMRSSYLLSDVDSYEDLKAEAWIAMQKVMDIFDLAACGPLADYDQAGKTKAKTLEFYFLNYFYQRVNFIASDASDQKKRRTGNSDWVRKNAQTILDDRRRQSVSLGQHGPEYELFESLNNELARHPESFQSFFRDRFMSELSDVELRNKYGRELRFLKRQLFGFVSDLKERLDLSEINVLGKKLRK